MRAWVIGKIVQNLKFEKVQGYTLSSLFITLVIIRLWGKTIDSATSNHFQRLCTVSKNTLCKHPILGYPLLDGCRKAPV